MQTHCSEQWLYSVVEIIHTFYSFFFFFCFQLHRASAMWINRITYTSTLYLAKQLQTTCSMFNFVYRLHWSTLSCLDYVDWFDWLVEWSLIPDSSKHPWPVLSIMVHSIDLGSQKSDLGMMLGLSYLLSETQKKRKNCSIKISHCQLLHGITMCPLIEVGKYCV